MALGASLFILSHEGLDPFDPCAQPIYTIKTTGRVLKDIFITSNKGHLLVHNYQLFMMSPVYHTCPREVVWVTQNLKKTIKKIH